MHAEVELWDIVAELVALCAAPSPANPFAVDLNFFDSLPAAERVLSTAAMLSFLIGIVDSGPHPYNKKGSYSYNNILLCGNYSPFLSVQSDMLHVSQCHFHALLELDQLPQTLPSVIT
jgi:hypothetical protein